MTLPANVGSTAVVGRFIRAILDTNVDSDREPDGIPIAGLTITFTASVPVVRNPAATPPVTIILEKITATTDATGTLVGPDGLPGVSLVASADPDLNPSGWTYTASITGGTFPAITINFIAPVGGEIDLTTVVPVSANPGVDVALWEEAIRQTEANVAAGQAILDAIQTGGANGTETVITVAQSTWSVPVPFDRRPTVVLYNANGEVVIADVFVNNKVVTVHLPAPMTGSVVLT